MMDGITIPTPSRPSLMPTTFVSTPSGLIWNLVPSTTSTPGNETRAESVKRRGAGSSVTRPASRLHVLGSRVSSTFAVTTCGCRLINCYPLRKLGLVTSGRLAGEFWPSRQKYHGSAQFRFLSANPISPWSYCACLVLLTDLFQNLTQQTNRMASPPLSKAHCGHSQDYLIEHWHLPFLLICSSCHTKKS